MKSLKPFLIVSTLIAIAACSGDAPQVPTTLSASSINNITAAAGSAVTTAPSVTLKDANGRGIAKVWVHFSVTGGGKVTNDSSQTDGSGLASSGGWTLGTAAGTQTLTATGASLSPVTFTAQVTAGPAATLTRNIADPQTGVVGTAVPNAPSAKALDVFGNPVSGVSVFFSTVNGAGIITGDTKTTNANGIATADAWTLGTVAGQQIARATSTGVSVPAAFSATAVAGAPAKITVVSGNNVNAVVNSLYSSFGTQATVRVTDQYDNPVGGVSVTFTPGPNSGAVTTATATTNDGGIATLGPWTLGTAASQSLTASLTTNATVKVVLTVTALQSQFNITLRYVGDLPSARQQLAVQRAVDKWKSIIVSNSGTSFINLPAGSCGRTWLPAIGESVTNVLILAQIGPIDGVGNVLGNGNTCATHTSSGLTSFGTILFDSADLATYEASGQIDQIVLHEMGHVLGFGTLWTSRGIISGRGSTDPIITGGNSIFEFASLQSGYSGRPVPVENCVGIPGCGGGTQDSHWRELVFRTEVMTGYLNSGVANPLSRVTVASMADLGYAVSYAGADPYTLTASLLFPGTTAIEQIHLGNDIVDHRHLQLRPARQSQTRSKERFELVHTVTSHSQFTSHYKSNGWSRRTMARPAVPTLRLQHRQAMQPIRAARTPTQPICSQKLDSYALAMSTDPIRTFAQAPTSAACEMGRSQAAPLALRHWNSDATNAQFPELTRASCDSLPRA